MTSAAPRPGVLDVIEAVSLTFAVVMVAALPPISLEFSVPPAGVGATVGVGLLGGLGLLAAFVAGSIRSRRVLPAAVLFLLGVGFWILVVVYLDPLLGWRVGIVTAWLAAVGLIAVSWFVLRRYPGRAYPALLLLAVGAAAASVAPSFPLLLAALSGGAAATFLVALLAIRSRPGPGSAPRQRSAAL